MLKDPPASLDEEDKQVLRDQLYAADKGTEEQELYLCQMFGVTGTEGGRRRSRKKRRGRRGGVTIA